MKNYHSLTLLVPHCFKSQLPKQREYKIIASQTERYIRTNIILNDPFELPSLEEIEQMERQRSQAIQSLEIYDHSVKCQRCAHDVPIVGKLNRPCNDRTVILLGWKTTIMVLIL
jgi:hypothetical protein